MLIICNAFLQDGWLKWGAEQPGWYARQAHATVPDWYARRTETVRDGYLKEKGWSYDLTSKPTERSVYSVTKPTDIPVKPWQRGYQAVPHDVRGEIQMPRWGLHHPHHYEDPMRAEPVAGAHFDEKTLNRY